jgi:hypothetical protein
MLGRQKRGQPALFGINTSATPFRKYHEPARERPNSPGMPSNTRQGTGRTGEREVVRGEQLCRYFKYFGRMEALCVAWGNSRLSRRRESMSIPSLSGSPRGRWAGESVEIETEGSEAVAVAVAEQLFLSRYHGEPASFPTVLSLSGRYWYISLSSGGISF